MLGSYYISFGLALAARLVVANDNVRLFELNLTWEPHAPDGHSREMILVNGQSPGPRLDITEGQEVIVKVHNKTPFNTTLHFHGIEMHNTPWSDGVPGVTQRGIQPSRSFEYRWTATNYGSYFYHAHSHGQIEDGMYGPITIRPSKNRVKPFGLISSDPQSIHAMEMAEKKVKPLMLTDFRHMVSTEVWDTAVAAGFELPCYDAVLLNGKGSAICRSTAEIESLLVPDQIQLLGAFNAAMTDKACFPPEVMLGLGGGVGNLSAVPPGSFRGCTPSHGGMEVIHATKRSCQEEKWLALDIVGAFNFITAMFSIDEQSMWVYAMDGEYVTPQKVNAIPVTNGDRYSVLIKVERAGDFLIRVAALSAPQLLSGYGKLSLREEGNEAEINDSVPWTLDNGVPTSPDIVVFSQPLAKPFPPDPISPKADAFYKLEMKIDGASYLWALNGTRLEPGKFESEEPVLFSPDPYVMNNVTISTINGTWVDLVFMSNMLPMPPHPIHKHGTKMYMIGAGTGEWRWSSVQAAILDAPQFFNIVDPPRRDTFATPPAFNEPAWMAVRYHVTNPGAWLIHCHIQNHMMGGMNMIIQDGVDTWPVVPEEYLNYH